MSDASQHDRSPSRGRAVDQACNHFEQAWRAVLSGAPSYAAPRIEDFLLDLEPTTRASALRELVALDVYYRRKLGEHPVADDYGARFPDLDVASLDWLLQDVAVGAATAHSTVNFPPGETRVSDLKPGQKVSYFGDYELLEEIAQGGMGIVYKARQVSLNRLVALKMIRAGVFATAAEIERFVQEAKMAAKLDHPHIVPIFEVNEHKGQHYYAMKLIEGGSLAQQRDAWCLNPELTRSETHRRQEKIANLLVTTAQAVHNAHQHGIMHRDLKPGNILIDAAGEPHVTDFGLAKEIDSNSAITQSGGIVGTASYMSPEQTAGGKGATTLSDVYGLGAVLYELLTGRPPFKGATPVDTMIEVRQQEVVHPRTLVPRVDCDLETICLKCLEKDADRRYGSAEALVADLERWQRGEPIEAKQAGNVERVIKWVRRNPTSTALAAVSIVALVAVVGFAVAQSYNQSLADLNNKLEIANSSLETTNNELTNTNAKLETANGKLGNAVGELKESNVNLSKTATKLKFAISAVEEQKRTARQYMYVAHMALAQQAEDEKQPHRVVQILRSVIPENPDQEDLRGWEWHHLWRKYHGEKSRLRGHTEVVTAVAFSPDEQLLASASADKTIKLWDARTGKLIKVMVAHDDRVTSLAFSPDSERLASASTDKTVKIWGKDGGLLRSLSGHGMAVTCVAFSHDNALVASGSQDRTVLVWDVQTGNRTRQFDMPGEEGVLSVAFHPKKKILVIGGPDAVISWDPVTGKRGPAVDGCKAGAGLAFDAEGTLLFAATTSGKSYGIKGTIKVWTWKGEGEKTLLEITRDQRGAIFTQVAVSPDGKHFSAANLTESLHLWEASSNTETILHVGEASRCMAFSPDGSRIAVGTRDGAILLWSVPGTETKTMKGGKNNVSFARGERNLVVGGWSGT